MDKYDLVLDIIAHPEKYTSEELNEIMADGETREIYNLLCKTDAAVKANREINVDAEWETFSNMHKIRRKRPYKWMENRAATIAVVVCSSIVAVAAGIAVTVSVIENKPKQEPIRVMAGMDHSAVSSQDTIIAERGDTVVVTETPVIFENEPLETILQYVGNAYGVEVKFSNKEVSALHLYYKFDPALPLDEVISQLNTFEQINISRNGNTLTVD